MAQFYLQNKFHPDHGDEGDLWEKRGKSSVQTLWLSSLSFHDISYL